MSNYRDLLIDLENLYAEYLSKPTTLLVDVENILRRQNPMRLEEIKYQHKLRQRLLNKDAQE